MCTYIVLVATVTVIYSQLPVSYGYCVFPEYLWKAAVGDGDDRRWTTQTVYPSGYNTNWTSQHEISVRQMQITVKNVTRALCFDPHTNASVTCFRKDLLHRIVCVSEEPGHMYRVQIKSSGNPQFTCMKFILRGRNIVQIWAASPIDVNEDRLCLKDSIHRDNWPWIVQRKEHWTFCPFPGGFDFRTQSQAKRKPVQRTCKQQWRPSRIEIECILGEGINFHFPDDRCSVLDNSLAESPLHCWGSWTEDDQVMTIIGRSDLDPQYAMRFPKDTDTLKEFSVDFYFAPVVPLQPNDVTLSGVVHEIFHMIRSDPGVCYDESEFCSQFARDGKCINSALHKFANFCKKSCGLCGHKADLVPSIRSECYFPEEYRGKWLLFESDRLEDVTIELGHVTFSKLGNYICKSKHWKKDQYKMLSTYTNGCRPRYSCMHFRMDGIVLYFQMSKSSMLDRSFDLCEFRDDPEPLRDKIRSRRMKLLLPEGRTRFNNCGLGGTVPINATFADDLSCNGVLSDWDTSRCHSKSLLTLSLRPCPRQYSKEFQCIAHADINDGTTIVITKETAHRGANYQCWVVHTHAERMSYRPWKQASIFDRAQCGTASDLMTVSHEHAIMTIHTYTDSASTSCTSPHLVLHQANSSPAAPHGGRFPLAPTDPYPEFNAASRWPRYTVLPHHVTERSRRLTDVQQSNYKTVYSKISNANSLDFLLRSTILTVIITIFIVV